MFLLIPTSELKAAPPGQLLDLATKFLATLPPKET